MADLNDVRAFWERNPLWAGESRHGAGTRAFFEEHREVALRDCLAGRFDDRLLPQPENRDHVLDLGCGPGLWTVELLERSAATHMTAADLTDAALELTRARLDSYSLTADTRRENAEAMAFPDATFSHVNCLGVVHHTPSPSRAAAEIHRVLRPGGTACISVYYSNALVRHWPRVVSLARLLDRLGGGLRGRGRDGLLTVADPEELVRLYDGRDNPVGRAFTRRQFLELLAPHFVVEELFFHYFPARALPWPVPHAVHRLLDRALPFMVYARVRKR